MKAEQGVTEILEEAIRALTVLDLDKLEELEARVSSLAHEGASRSFADSSRLHEKKRLLGLLLENCRSNLDALHRLHAKNTERQWAH